MKRTKIVFVHHGSGIGGAPTSLLLLVQNLDRSRYEPIVVFLHDSAVIDWFVRENVMVVGPVHLHDTPHSVVRWYRWYHLHRLLCAWWHALLTVCWYAPRLYRRLCPDIVHLNTSSLLAWGWVAAAMGIPVAWHVREPLAAGYIGLRRMITKNLVQRCARAIIPISYNDARPWQGRAQVHVVPNVVDEKKFCPALTVPLRQQKQILFLGGASEVKGTHHILEIFWRLLQRMSDAHLTIAGYWNLDLPAYWHPRSWVPTAGFIRQLRLRYARVADQVTIVGPIEDVAARMQATNVVVFPASSGHFARPVIEAGFMQRVVIASDLAPLPELVRHGETGFLLPPNDYECWAAHLYRLLSDTELSMRMGRAAHAFCRDRFSLAGQIQAIDKIYQSIGTTS